MNPHDTSNRRRRFRIYLAGPISGCNDEQKRFWREHVRDRFTDIFDYIDPLEGPVDDTATPYQLVERDLRAIEQADAILAHMWRESIGTAMGLVHAKSKGKVVVVSDPNRLNNRLLQFYADVVEHDLDRALKSLRDLLRSQDGLIVMRRDGVEQPFDRVELTESVRQACRQAGLHDIVVPRLVVARVVEKLLGTPRKVGGHQIASGEIQQAVDDVIGELERSEEHRAAVAGLRAAWRDVVRERRGGPGTRRAAPGAVAGPLVVRVWCGPKSHATIWGKTVRQIGDVPSLAARQILQEIVTVPGISEVRLTTMGRGAVPESAAACLLTSATPTIIEGKIFDNGPKGQVQAFQIFVHDPASTAQIQEQVTRRLREAGVWSEKGRAR